MKGTLHFNDACLLIFDEAHHALGGHGFNKIMIEFYQKAPLEQRPKILGLTASPGTTSKDVKNLMSNLDAIVVKVKKYANELKKFYNVPPPKLVLVSYKDQENHLRKLLFNFLQNSLQNFNKHAAFSKKFGFKSYSLSKRSWSCSSWGKVLNGAFEKIKNEIFQIRTRCSGMSKKEGMRRKGVQRYLIIQMRSIFSVLKTLSYFGLEDGAYHLRKEWDIENPRGKLQDTEKVREFKYLPSKLKEKEKEKNSDSESTNVSKAHISSQKREILCFLKNIPIPTGMNKDGKFGQLVEELSKINAEERTKESLRIIVFVEERRFALELVERLSGVLSFIRPTYIIGHTDMSVNQQTKAVDKFRGGHFNLVVATSVLEEGFDVPICNMIIRMTPPTSVTALVQSRGRGRDLRSTFINILRHEEQKRFQELVHAEKKMNAMSSKSMQATNKHKQPQGIPGKKRKKNTVKKKKTKKKNHKKFKKKQW